MYNMRERRGSLVRQSRFPREFPRVGGLYQLERQRCLLAIVVREDLMTVIE